MFLTSSEVFVYKEAIGELLSSSLSACTLVQLGNMGVPSLRRGNVCAQRRLSNDIFGLNEEGANGFTFDFDIGRLWIDDDEPLTSVCEGILS